MEKTLKLLLCVLLLAVTFIMSSPVQAADRPAPEVGLQAIALDVLDEVIQQQRRWILSTKWENIGWPEERYTLIVFMNGYECTGTTTTYTASTFDGMYYERYRIVNYIYRTW